MTEAVPVAEYSTMSLRQSELPAKNWIQARLLRLPVKSATELPLFRQVLERILDVPAYFFYLDPSRDNYLKNNVEQNTDEWYALRKTGPILPRPNTDDWVPSPITASVAGSLFEAYYDQTSQETILKMLGRGKPFSGNDHTRRGHAKEPDVREMMRLCLNEPIDTTGVHAHAVFPCCMMVSPDGVLRNQPMSVEIKCPFRITQTTEIPFGYSIQMLLQAMCQDRPTRKIDRVLYTAASMSHWESKIHMPLYFDQVVGRTLFRSPTWEDALLDRALYAWGLCVLMGKEYTPPKGLLYTKFPEDWDSPVPARCELLQSELPAVNNLWRTYACHVPYVVSEPMSPEEEEALESLDQ